MNVPAKKDQRKVELDDLSDEVSQEQARRTNGGKAAPVPPPTVAGLHKNKGLGPPAPKRLP